MYSFSRIDTDPIGTTPQQSFNNYTTALFAHVNGAADKELAARAKQTFGDIPAYNKEQDSFIGRALVSNAGYTGDPFSYLRNNNRPIPENTLTEYELYHHIGKEFVANSQKHYAEWKSNAEALLAKQNKAIKDGLDSLAAILASGRTPNAQEMAAFTDAKLTPRFNILFQDVQEAVSYLQSISTITPQKLKEETERVKKEWYDSVHFAWTKDRTEEQHMQQAAANLQEGYNLTREQYNTIISLLKDDNGNLDPAAIALFTSTLNHKANKEQTIDSAFWRNVAFGISDFAKNTGDFLGRGYLDIVATGGVVPMGDTYYQPTQKEVDAARIERANNYSPDIEKLRAGMLAVHDNALNPAEEASELAKVLTQGGTIVGSEIIPLAASSVATLGMGTAGSLLVGGAVNAASRFPSTASRNISEAYAAGKKNPLAYALISTPAQVGIESLFAAGLGLGVGRAASNAVFSAALNLPGFARAAGAVQSSALLRWATGSTAEAFGELFIEDPAATLTNKAIFESINSLAGRDVFNAPEWSSVKKAFTSNIANPSQAAAITAYSFVLGAFGFGIDTRKAYEYAKNRDNLLASAFSQKAATEISTKAEELSEQLAVIQTNPELSAQAKQEQTDKLLLDFTEFQQKKLQDDVLDAKPEELIKRLRKNHFDYMEKAQAIHAIATGSVDAALKAQNATMQTLPSGNRLLTYKEEETKADGSTELKEKKLELSDAQFLNFVISHFNKSQQAAMADYQSAVLGNALVRKARTVDDIKHDLVNVRDLAAAAPAYAHIAAKGAIDYDAAVLIAKAAKATRDHLIEQGITLEQANTSADPNTGATLESLINLPAAFTQRVTDAAKTTEGKAAKIDKGSAQSVALRLPSAKSLGDSIVLYVGGNATLANIAEELTESDLIRAINAGTITLEQAKENLLHLQSELRNYDPNLSLLPSDKKIEDITFQNIVEAYSTLQELDILSRAARFNLSPTSKAIIDYTLGQTDIARALRTAADAWATYANSEAGKAYLGSTGKTLSVLLDAAGLQQSKLYSDLRAEESDRIATEAANGFPLAALDKESQARLDKDAAAADKAALTNTEPDIPRTEIPAEESVTGEPIAVDPLETADNDPTTGEYNPSPLEETGTDPSFNSPVTKSPFGITTGMMPPANLKPHPALPTSPNRPSSIDHRTSTYNPNAKPILALRMPDGNIYIVNGRTAHAIALADPDVTAVKVSVLEYDPEIHTDDWVLMTNAAHHLGNRTATTEHVTTYFTHNPITHAQAIEQGLVPIDPRTGKPTAAYIKGRQEAERILADKAEASAAAAAAEAKAKAEKQLPGKTKWATPSKKSKPLSDSETKQTLISVAAHGLSKYKDYRFQFTHTLTQRKKGTEYTVATDGRRITIISQPTYKPDTDDATQEWHSNKGEKSKENQQAPKWTQVIPARFRGETTINLSYYSFLGKGLKGPAKNKHIDSPLLNNNQYIVVNSTNGFLSLNPIYVRDAYKQIVDLGKKLGFSPIVKLQYNDKASPVMFTAEHNGIKWQHLLMPVHRTEEVTPGDIILGEQPTIYGEEQTAPSIDPLTQDSGSFSLRVPTSQQETLVSSLSLRRRPDRNLASILSNREKTLLQVSTYIKRHANRTARVIGADSDKLRAGVHFAQANAIIAALDKYIFPQDLISRGSAEYRKLKDLRSLLEEFVRIAQTGKLPARRQTKDGRETTKARIRALLDAQMKQAPTLLAEDGSTQPDMTAKDIRKDLITRLAKEDAAQVLAVMMDGLGQIIETHLRNSILDKISTSLKAMRPKANAYGRYKRNIFSADTQRKLDLTASFINLKESEKAAIQDQLDHAWSILSVIAASLSAPNPPSPQSILQTLPDGIVKQAYEHLVSRGGEVTIDMLEEAITSISNTFQTFAYLDEGSFKDALSAYMHLNELVTDARFSWDAKAAADRERRNAYIEEAIAAVPQQIATANYREKKKTNALGSFFDNLMSAGQLFYSLAGTDGFRSVAMNTMSRIASASPAILTAQKEIEYSLAEAYLRCFKPGIHANLPEDTKARQAILRKHLNKDFNAFVVDMQKELDTGIILQPELAPSVKAVRERQGENAPEDFTQTLKLSKFEALNIILTGEQPEYQKNLLYHGYTPEVMSQLREKVGDELMEFGYFMRSLLINSGVAQVYAERTGHNLPDNPYYWPSHIDHITHTKGESKPDENKFRTAGTDNFLKKRVVSMGEIKPIDALTVFRNNMTERLNYIYMRPITDEWHSLLANPHFAHRLEGSIGKDRMKKLRAALDVLDNAAAADAYMNGVFNKLISSFHSARAVSLLSGNIGTFIRQATAFNHVGILTNSGLASYAQTVIDTFNGKTQISLSEMLRTPQFQARYQNSKFYEELQREAENASWNKIKQTSLNISNLGMEAIGRVDTWANAVSACVYYNVRHKEYSSQYPNLTKQELHDKCMQDVAIMLELVAQPLLQHQKSLYAATTTNAIIKAGCFMGTELLNKLGMARAAYLKAGGGFNGTLAQAKVLAAVGIPAAIINIMFAWLNDEMPDDEVDKYAFLTSQALQGATGISILFNLPLFGGFVSQAFQPSYYNKGEWQNILPDVSNTATHYGNLFKICTGENSSWTNEELAKTINQCSRDAAQLASLAQTLPFLRETTSTISAAMGAVAAASNTLRVPASVAGNIINSDKRIPGSKNNTRKKSYRQPVMEKLLSEHIFADTDYEKRKAAAKRERSRHTRRENRKKKAEERKAKQQQNRQQTN